MRSPKKKNKTQSLNPWPRKLPQKIKSSEKRLKNQWKNQDFVTSPTLRREVRQDDGDGGGDGDGDGDGDGEGDGDGDGDGDGPCFICTYHHTNISLI